MNYYDTFMEWLYKNGECTREVALTLLDKYKNDQDKYKQLNRLVQQKKIKRIVHPTKGIIYKPFLHPVKFVPKAEEPAEQDTTLDTIAAIYRYLVRYGRQHYATPGRVNTLAVARTWLNQRRDLIQFLHLLIELIESDTSFQEYCELEAGLKEAGWYSKDYDALDAINDFIGLVVAKVEVEADLLTYGALGYSREEWESLRDPNSYRRL